MRYLKSKSFFEVVVTFLVILVVLLMWPQGSNISSADSNRVKIDFSTYPGPDGLLGTADDIAVNIGDTVMEQYAALGAHFAGLNFIDFCCEFDFTLGVLAISGPFSITFDVPQKEVLFDAKAILIAAGNALPVTLRDSNQNVISSFTLTNADALPSSGNSVLGGHFRILRATPFSRIDFGATLPDSGGFFFDNLDFEALAPKVINVNMDIKPGSYPNTINIKSHGVIPVAILTTPTFNAFAVDANSISFGVSKASAVRFAVKQSAMEDVDADGDLDLILHFDIDKLGILCKSTSLILTGRTRDGKAILGTDQIKIIGCK